MIASKDSFEPHSSEQLPASKKVFVAGTIHADVQVPMREISVTDTKSYTGAVTPNDPVLAPGEHRLTLGLAGLTDGRHQVRITTNNGGLSGERLAGTVAFAVNVDQTSPALTDVSFRRTVPDQVAVGWIGGDPRSGVASARFSSSGAESVVPSSWMKRPTAAP